MNRENNPLVSVCVTAYNHEKYIKRCIDSILQQKTNFFFEILLGEDDSQDATRKICREYASRHPEKIKLFLHNRKNVIYINGHPTGHYNSYQNLKAASGKYIAFCDGDDAWNDENKLQKQVDFLEKNPEFSISHHNAFIIRSGENCGLKIAHPTSYELKDFAKGISILKLTAVFRKDCLKSLPNYFLEVYNADSFLFTHCLLYGKSYFHFDITPSLYTVSAESMWSSKSENFRIKTSYQTFYAIFGYLPPSYFLKYCLRFLHKQHGVLINKSLTTTTRVFIFISNFIVFLPMSIKFKIKYLFDKKSLF